ncbi:MAG: HAD family hydrolase [Negativicutes bacterium]|nr:HAD family hydrolase [Negativicutes bacterium]
MKNAIIFDLDGTLWDVSRQVLPAWNRVLQRHSEVNRQITIADLHSYMGKTIADIAQIMLPELPLVQSLKIMDECAVEEQLYLREHGGVLYPHLEEMLASLKKNYLLFIVSNCQDGYIESFLEFHKLTEYFTDTECAGRTGLSKGENIKLVMARNQIERAVYVGDTEGDLKAARLAAIPFIHAAYGYGRIDSKEVSIAQLSELPQTVKMFFTI